MKMREIWLKFTKETGVHISLALFGELSVRYVMRSNPAFMGVVRTRGIHDKKYSLRWKPLPIGGYKSGRDFGGFAPTNNGFNHQFTMQDLATNFGTVSIA